MVVVVVIVVVVVKVCVFGYFSCFGAYCFVASYNLFRPLPFIQTSIFPWKCRKTAKLWWPRCSVPISCTTSPGLSWTFTYQYYTLISTKFSLSLSLSLHRKYLSFVCDNYWFFEFFWFFFCRSFLPSLATIWNCGVTSKSQNLWLFRGNRWAVQKQLDCKALH